ncbi:hypothetical protein Clacol_007465 [Clathrus columnatus]|uniref:NTF2 domain-containing protein n=1 Tax=Clathrus columnatus TaxID=1419009 RepID=A0AAV5AF03_9AGAM|nr:hypothetical protein Clacol_007465 [Clathrus columnatus]
MITLTTSELYIASVEIANRGADEFLRVYYATYDSAQRAEGVVKFYRETSHLTYNGTTVTGPEGIKTPLIFNDTPLAATSPPALLITVSGLVSHGPGATASATGGTESITSTTSAGVSNTATAGQSKLASRNVDAQPRVFSQTFVLMKSEAEDKYYVASDHFRFVG